MTQSGDPRENAIAERVNGILKGEWLDRERLKNIEQAKTKVAKVITLYNTKRPHLSIDYMTPQQAHSSQGEIKKRWKTYYKKKEMDTILNHCVSLSIGPLVDSGGYPPESTKGRTKSVNSNKEKI